MSRLCVLLAAALLACPAFARAGSFFDLCDQAQAAKDPAVSIDLYTQALGAWMPADTEANRAMVFNNRAISHQTLKQHDKALADYNASIGIAPRDAATLENRGTVLESLNQPDAALVDYERALKIDPNRPKTHHHAAVIYFKKKKPAQALKNLDRVLALTPRDAAALNLRALVYGQLDEPEKALADYKRAMATDPNDPTPWVNRGLLFSAQRKSAAAGADFVMAAEIYRKLKKPELELAELERAVQTSPRTPRPRAARGGALLIRGRLEEAEADGLKAASLDARDPGGEVLLGRLSFERGDFEGAGRIFEAALAIKADEGMALLGLAFAAYKLGKLDDVRARWKQALKLSPFLAEGQDRAEGEGYSFTAKEAEVFKALSSVPAAAKSKKI